MTLAPLLDAPLAIQIHVAGVIPAAIIGAWLMLAPKGTPGHRLLGTTWLGLMVVVSLSSFFIQQIRVFMGFSPLHLLSILVLVGSFFAYHSARRHKIRVHRIQVSLIYFGGIIVAGVFALLPGRLMNTVVIGQGEALRDFTGPILFAGGMLAMTLVLIAIARFVVSSRLALRRHSPSSERI